jgi:hypothetical protein
MNARVSGIQNIAAVKNWLAVSASFDVTHYIIGSPVMQLKN